MSQRALSAVAYTTRPIARKWLLKSQRAEGTNVKVSLRLEDALPYRKNTLSSNPFCTGCGLSTNTPTSYGLA